MGYCSLLDSKSVERLNGRLQQTSKQNGTMVVVLSPCLKEKWECWSQLDVLNSGRLGNPYKIMMPTYRSVNDLFVVVAQEQKMQRPPHDGPFKMMQLWPTRAEVGV